MIDGAKEFHAAESVITLAERALRLGDRECARVLWRLACGRANSAMTLASAPGLRLCIFDTFAKLRDLDERIGDVEAV